MPDDKVYPDARHIPGGKIDYEKTDSLIEQTLKREIEEETGVVVEDNVEYLGNMACAFGEYQVLSMFFLTQWKSGEPYAREEVQDARWLTREEVCKLKKHWLLDKAYEALMKKIG